MTLHALFSMTTPDRDQIIERMATYILPEILIGQDGDAHANADYVAVVHTDTLTVVITDRGEFEVGRNWPLTFVEPIATVTPMRVVKDQEPA